MTPYWLLVDVRDLATFAALTFFAGCAWVAFAAREFANHRPTVDGPSPEASPAASGEAPWIVEASEREPACAASTPAPPQLVAAETTQVAARTCPTPVGVGDPVP